MINQFNPKDQNRNLENLKEQIDELSNLDVQSTSLEILENKLRALLKGHLLMIFDLDQSKHMIYRAVKWDYKPQKIADVIYSPNVTNRGRVNNKGEQYFYCSINPDIPFMELNVEVGDKFVLTKWGIADPVRLMPIGYEINNIQSIKNYRFPPAWMDQKFFKEVDMDAYNLIEKYISKNFCYKFDIADENKYIYSNLIAKIAFSKGVQSNGLIYPCVANDLVQESIAFKKDYFDNGGLSFIHAEWIEIIDKRDNGDFLKKYLDIATEFDDDENLIWLGRPYRYDLCDYPKAYYSEWDREMIDTDGQIIHKS